MKKSFFALALGTFGLGISEFVMMGILPYVAADFQVGIAEAGHLISAYALGVCVGAPAVALSPDGYLLRFSGVDGYMSLAGGRLAVAVHVGIDDKIHARNAPWRIFWRGEHRLRPHLKGRQGGFCNRNHVFGNDVCKSHWKSALHFHNFHIVMALCILFHDGVGIGDFVLHFTLGAKP